MDIFVTSIGLVSAAGNGIEENLLSLQSGRTGIQQSEPSGLMLGEVLMSNASIVSSYQLPPADYSRTTLLGIVAATEAWGSSRTVDSSLRTGIVSSTSVGGLDRMEAYYFEGKRANHQQTHPMMTHDNGGTTEHIARALGISGHIGTISTACSSGANAIMQGARMILANKLDRVLVGGVDPLAHFNINGFRSLGIYDPAHCRPFDASRSGLNLGEGAAYLVLENAESMKRMASQPICRLTGWNNSTDAYHQTASSANGKGAALAMERALKKADLTPSAIDYLNAHGTGTRNNDLSESMAIRRIFGDQIPPFSSTKAFTGHTLAAAGAIEAVYCVLAIEHGSIFPNLNFATAMEETALIPATRSLNGQRLQHVLSNSFGFGGNCSSLIFSNL
ncbi:MAG: beta-ketoacyl-[acyl-carrier-protein] synthase family protein [Bacteroidota bacterium]